MLGPCSVPVSSVDGRMLPVVQRSQAFVPSLEQLGTLAQSDGLIPYILKCEEHPNSFGISFFKEI